MVAVVLARMILPVVAEKFGMPLVLTEIVIVKSATTGKSFVRTVWPKTDKVPNSTNESTGRI